jgi:hypothetical protein
MGFDFTGCCSNHLESMVKMLYLKCLAGAPVLKRVLYHPVSASFSCHLGNRPLIHGKGYQGLTPIPGCDRHNKISVQEFKKQDRSEDTSCSWWGVLVKTARRRGASRPCCFGQIKARWHCPHRFSAILQFRHLKLREARRKKDAL